MKLMNKFMKKHEGFTLVELIVVIAILAILAGVAVPVYSGYVKKAERAADEQLLAAVNMAFAAACIENGTDVHNITNAAMDINPMEVTSVAGGDAEAFNTAFQYYFAGNEEAEFKVFVGLKFVNGKFVNADGGMYANLTFDKALIDLVKNSSFFTAEGLGVSSLMNKVDFITSLASSLADPDANNGEGNGAYKMLNAYSEDLLADLGIDLSDLENVDPDDPEAMEAVLAPYYALIDEKMAALDAQGGAIWEALGDDDYARRLYAENSLLSNYAVLDAAQQIKGKGTDEILSEIKNESNFTGLILSSQDEDGVGIASAAYGLYTAYAHSIEDSEKRAAAVEKLDNPKTLLESLDDPDFRTYLGSDAAKTDLNGYLAAMEMIDSSASDEDTVRNLMINGFTDPDLLAVIQQAMK